MVFSIGIVVFFFLDIEDISPFPVICYNKPFDCKQFVTIRNFLPFFMLQNYAVHLDFFKGLSSLSESDKNFSQKNLYTSPNFA